RRGGDRRGRGPRGRGGGRGLGSGRRGRGGRWGRLRRRRGRTETQRPFAGQAAVHRFPFRIGERRGERLRIGLAEEIVPPDVLDPPSGDAGENQGEQESAENPPHRPPSPPFA